MRPLVLSRLLVGVREALGVRLGLRLSMERVLPISLPEAPSWRGEEEERRRRGGGEGKEREKRGEEEREREKRGGGEEEERGEGRESQ